MSLVAFGKTAAEHWIETLPTQHDKFSGRTFCRSFLRGSDAPSVVEIWATADHAVDAHAHDTDEVLFVLRGAIEINGVIVGTNELVFIPRGQSYSAKVVSAPGSHVLRIALTNSGATPQYGHQTWLGFLTEDGYPDLERSGCAGQHAIRTVKAGT